MGQCISYLYTSSQPMIHLKRRPCVIFFLTEFGFHMKMMEKCVLLKPIVEWPGKHLSDMLRSKDSFKQEDCFSTRL